MKRWTAGKTQKELNSTIEIHCLKDVLGAGEGPLIRTFWIQGPSPRPVGQGPGTENLEGPNYRTFQVTSDFYTQFFLAIFFLRDSKQKNKVPVKGH